MSSTATDGPPSEVGGTSLFPYFLILFGMSAGLASVMTLLAEFRNQLGFSQFGIGLGIASGFVAAFVASVALAPQADRGRAPLMLRSGLLLGIAGLLVVALTNDLWHFVVGRALFGLAFGIAHPAARRTVIVADPENLGRNVGRLGAFDVAGFVVGPSVAALLHALGGFRLPFWVMAVLLTLLIPTCWQARPDTAAKDMERRRPTDLFRNRRLIGAFFVVASYFVFIGAFESIWVLEMDHRGAEQWQIGVAVTVAAAPMAILAPWGGVLAQRYGARRWALGVLTTCALFSASFGLVEGLVALVVLTIVCSCAEGIGFPSTPMLVSAAVPEDRQAAAQGLASAVEVGTAAVTSVGGAVIYESSGDTVAWAVTAVVMGVLLVVGWVLTRPPDRQPVRPGVPFGLARRLFE
ncbi:MAG: MFS transporter [Acidimicrobiales bacterium]|nr:MFS transporter [Acidimicrobiales bacterium]MDP6650171.1 MFS transporter [Acidimicrobiales bacterium]MDP6759633.1 MFS transporter [Acidimicrobiales bacterium]